MLELLTGNRSNRVLCLGAHCDDLEIGCAATLLRMIGEGAVREVLWIVFAGSEAREAEARAAGSEVLAGISQYEIRVESFRNGFFPYIGGEIKEYFERLKRDFEPDLVFTHWGGDYHQDHREISRLTWNTFRNHRILEYEIPKYDGDLGRPNVYVTVTEDQSKKKINTILQNFKSQSSKHWFDRRVFQGLMRLRGMEAASPTGLAEAFFARKLVL